MAAPQWRWVSQDCDQLWRLDEVSTFAIAAAVEDGHMAHRRTPSSTCTSATITASKRKQSTIAVTTKSDTKTHGKDSRAELGGELGGLLLA